MCGGIGEHAARCVCFKGFKVPADEDRRRQWANILRPNPSEGVAVALPKKAFVHINHFDSAHVLVSDQRINLKKAAVPHLEPTVSPTSRQRARQHPDRDEIAGCTLNFDSFATPAHVPGAASTPRTLPQATRLLQKQADVLDKQAESLDAAKEAIQHANAQQQALDVLLEQTENSLRRKDKELKTAQEKYDALIKRVDALERAYVNVQELRETNKELQVQVKALQEAVEAAIKKCKCWWTHCKIRGWAARVI